MDIKQILSLISTVRSLTGGSVDKWRGNTPTSFEDVKEDIEALAQGVMEPLKDGFQLPDLLAMGKPLMAGIMSITGVMNLPDSSEDPDALTKQSLAITAYNHVVNHFDPEIDFEFPWFISFAETWAEDAAEALILSAVRELGPALVEYVFALASQQFPEILG